MDSCGSNKSDTYSSTFKRKESVNSSKDFKNYLIDSFESYYLSNGEIEIDNDLIQKILESKIDVSPAFIKTIKYLNDTLLILLEDKKYVFNEPPRLFKTQWDFLLQEVSWLARDFYYEHSWKIAKLFRISYEVKQYHYKMRKLNPKKVASDLSCDITRFWIGIVDHVCPDHISDSLKVYSQDISIMRMHWKSNIHNYLDELEYCNNNNNNNESSNISSKTLSTTVYDFTLCLSDDLYIYAISMIQCIFDRCQIDYTSKSILDLGQITTNECYVTNEESVQNQAPAEKNPSHPSMTYSKSPLTQIDLYYMDNIDELESITGLPLSLFGFSNYLQHRSLANLNFFLLSNNFPANPSINQFVYGHGQISSKPFGTLATMVYDFLATINDSIDNISPLSINIMEPIQLVKTADKNENDLLLFESSFRNIVNTVQGMSDYIHPVCLRAPNQSRDIILCQFLKKYGQWCLGNNFQFFSSFFLRFLDIISIFRGLLYRYSKLKTFKISPNENESFVKTDTNSNTYCSNVCTSSKKMKNTSHELYVNVKEENLKHTDDNRNLNILHNISYSSYSSHPLSFPPSPLSSSSSSVIPQSNLSVYSSKNLVELETLKINPLDSLFQIPLDSNPIYSNYRQNIFIPCEKIKNSVEIEDKFGTCQNPSFVFNGSLDPSGDPWEPVEDLLLAKLVYNFRYRSSNPPFSINLEDQNFIFLFKTYWKVNWDLVSTQLNATFVPFDCGRTPLKCRTRWNDLMHQALKQRIDHLKTLQSLPNLDSYNDISICLSFCEVLLKEVDIDIIPAYHPPPRIFIDSNKSLKPNELNLKCTDLCSCNVNNLSIEILNDKILEESLNLQDFNQSFFSINFSEAISQSDCTSSFRENDKLSCYFQTEDFSMNNSLVIDNYPEFSITNSNFDAFMLHYSSINLQLKKPQLNNVRDSTHFNELISLYKENDKYQIDSVQELFSNISYNKQSLEDYRFSDSISEEIQFDDNEMYVFWDDAFADGLIEYSDKQFVKQESENIGYTPKLKPELMNSTSHLYLNILERNNLSGFSTFDLLFNNYTEFYKEYSDSILSRIYIPSTPSNKFLLFLKENLVYPSFAKIKKDVIYLSGLKNYLDSVPPLILHHYSLVCKDLKVPLKYIKSMINHRVMEINPHDTFDTNSINYTHQHYSYIDSLQNSKSKSNIRIFNDNLSPNLSINLLFNSDATSNHSSILFQEYFDCFHSNSNQFKEENINLFKSNSLLSTNENITQKMHIVKDLYEYHIDQYKLKENVSIFDFFNDCEEFMYIPPNNCYLESDVTSILKSSKIRFDTSKNRKRLLNNWYTEALLNIIIDAASDHLMLLELRRLCGVLGHYGNLMKKRSVINSKAYQLFLGDQNLSSHITEICDTIKNSTAYSYSNSRSNNNYGMNTNVYQLSFTELLNIFNINITKDLISLHKSQEEMQKALSVESNDFINSLGSDGFLSSRIPLCLNDLFYFKTSQSIKADSNSDTKLDSHDFVNGSEELNDLTNVSMCSQSKSLNNSEYPDVTNYSIDLSCFDTQSDQENELQSSSKGNITKIERNAFSICPALKPELIFSQKSPCELFSETSLWSPIINHVELLLACVKETYNKYRHYLPFIPVYSPYSKLLRVNTSSKKSKNSTSKTRQKWDFLWKTHHIPSMFHTLLTAKKPILSESEVFKLYKIHFLWLSYKSIFDYVSVKPNEIAKSTIENFSGNQDIGVQLPQNIVYQGINRNTICSTPTYNSVNTLPSTNSNTCGGSNISVNNLSMMVNVNKGVKMDLPSNLNTLHSYNIGKDDRTTLANDYSLFENLEKEFSTNSVQHSQWKSVLNRGFPYSNEINSLYYNISPSIPYKQSNTRGIQDTNSSYLQQPISSSSGSSSRNVYGNSAISTLISTNKSPVLSNVSIASKSPLLPNTNNLQTLPSQRPHAPLYPSTNLSSFHNLMSMNMVDVNDLPYMKTQSDSHSVYPRGSLPLSHHHHNSSVQRLVIRPSTSPTRLTTPHTIPRPPSSSKSSFILYNGSHWRGTSENPNSNYSQPVKTNTCNMPNDTLSKQDTISPLIIGSNRWYSHPSNISNPQICNNAISHQLSDAPLQSSVASSCQQQFYFQPKQLNQIQWGMNQDNKAFFSGNERVSPQQDSTSDFNSNVSELSNSHLNLSSSNLMLQNSLPINSKSNQILYYDYNNRKSNTANVSAKNEYKTILRHSESTLMNSMNNSTISNQLRTPQDDMVSPNMNVGYMSLNSEGSSSNTSRVVQSPPYFNKDSHYYLNSRDHSVLYPSSHSMSRPNSAGLRNANPVRSISSCYQPQQVSVRPMNQFNYDTKSSSEQYWSHRINALTRSNSLSPPNAMNTFSMPTTHGKDINDVNGMKTKQLTRNRDFPNVFSKNGYPTTFCNNVFQRPLISPESTFSPSLNFNPYYHSKSMVKDQNISKKNIYYVPPYHQPRQQELAYVPKSYPSNIRNQNNRSNNYPYIQ